MSRGAVEGPQSLRMKKLPSSRNGITTVRPAASQWQLRGWRSQSVGKARHRCIATPPVAQRLSQILLKGGGGPPPETCRVVGVGRSAKNTDRKGTAVSKTVSKLCLVERDEATELSELSEELRLQLAEVAGAAREGRLAMSVPWACG